MKTKLPLLLLSLLVACSTHKKTTDESPEQNSNQQITTSYFANTITSEELKELLYVYASDEFEGRETGKAGQKKAVNFLRDFYDTLGIKGALGERDYFQKVPLLMRQFAKGTLRVKDIYYPLWENFGTYETYPSAHVQNKSIVFAGYGIEDERYSDYSGLNVKDKWVLVKAGEPRTNDGNYVITGGEDPSKWSSLKSSFTDRIEAAKRHGALGLLFYDRESYPNLMKKFEWYKDLSEQDPKSMVLEDKDNTFLYFFIDEVVARKIMADIDKKNDPEEIIVDWELVLNGNSDRLESENVVAYIQGSEFPDQYVILSAHLDHIGISPSGEVNNGADDDGSGTVALLEIAEAFKEAEKMGHGPRRSLVFLHLTGEEKGLLGSEYYTNHPIFPLENTVADLNIDMIGRTDPKRSGNEHYIYLIGSDKLSLELHELSEQVNTTYTQLELDYTYNDENDPNRFYYRSDHYNFAKNNIPVIFYFNGTHNDYHRPSDTPDKIRYDLLKERTQLVFYTAWELANRPERIALRK